MYQEDIAADGGITVGGASTGSIDVYAGILPRLEVTYSDTKITNDLVVHNNVDNIQGQRELIQFHLATSTYVSLSSGSLV